MHNNHTAPEVLATWARGTLLRYVGWAIRARSVWACRCVLDPHPISEI